MRLFSLLLLLFCGLAYGQQGAYSIPRSQVIELTDHHSQHTYPLYIKLPASYAKNPSKHYPVIYLTDGHYSFQLVSGATRFPMNSGAMPEAILVAIGYAQGDKGQSSRVRDYTPTKESSWKLATGEAAKHARFIREQVFTHIQKNYRALATQRTYMGNSLGGLFGAYLLLQEPDMFSTYILGSPSVWFDNQSILALELKPSKAAPKVYIGVGSLETPAHGEGQDMVAGAQALFDKLRSLPASHSQIKLRIIEEARHATAFPSTSIQGLDWLLKEGE
ncbi:alpha/beta hydrolase [Pseudoalteromonas sp. T1lg22]|uniref:alpha/beta hydrolase n=1 Tax=Pseudoalteromonas sp. T1lg22 TaxID=2077096 RepID=UPI000CF731A0|nr:alpha/beta hydrolase-fold protein [Pseudoalteromonas sp. T1lg22]